MALPFTLPDWAPPWVGFVLLVVAGLFCLAFLLMPFSVFGLKGRLDAVEARLDEIQGEIRSLVLRLPEPRRTEYEVEAEPPRRWTEPPNRPPIPPRTPTIADRPPPSPTRRVEPPRRSEPRFDPS
jgi:hypothetical protein